MTFVTESGRVNTAKTVMSNMKTSILSEIKQLDLSGYDLVLNDFEPVSAWAAKQQNVPSIAISHQAALQYPVPK